MPLTKGKKKLNKLIEQSDSEESDHELSHYVNDRVKLMKEVLKTIKPKKIKAMAPSCLKHLEMEEINSMLLEELLGISNKRLKYIFNGQNLDGDSSSSTDENEPIDIISLDDVSDDEFIINLDDDEGGTSSKPKKVKKEHKHPKVKREKCIARKLRAKENEKTIKREGTTNKKEVNIDSNKNLMSVLELLELQARARAIKSQLLLENSKTQETCSKDKKAATIEEKVGSDDDVIIETIKAEEIVITSSESEDESKTEKEKSENGNKSSGEVDNEKTSTKDGECDVLDKKNDSVEIPPSPGVIEETRERPKVNIIENKRISIEEKPDENGHNSSSESKESNGLENKNPTEKIEKKTEKILDNEEIIEINLSSDEIDELK